MFNLMFLGLSCTANSSKNLVTILRLVRSSNLLNLHTTSILFLNSGLKNSFIAFSSSSSRSKLPNPILFFSASLAPRLLVIIITLLRQSTFFPLLLVMKPSSISCSNTLITSGCAFSISSNSITAFGFLSMSRINSPPARLLSSYPTYPGGAPINLLSA